MEGFLTKGGDYREALKILQNSKNKGKIIMFHGVSVGEVITLEKFNQINAQKHSIWARIF